MPEVSRDQFVDHRHYSPSAVVHEGTSKALIFVCAFVSAVSMMAAVWAVFTAMHAQERAEVLQYEVESFKNVLHSQGLPLHQHLPGESP